MEEYQYQAQRNDETDRKQPDTEERLPQGTAIGELLLNHLTADKPSQHDAREEGA